MRIARAGLSVCLLLAARGVQASASTSFAANRSSCGAFLAAFPTVSSLGSTVPASGDVNTYGIVSVPQSLGALHAGDLLISN